MKKLTGILLLLMFILPSARAELVTGTDEQAQLPFWEWRTPVISVRFVQRLPDQSRAYFAGRGFEPNEVKLIAEHCIFQTVFKNVAPADTKQVIEYDLNEWAILYKGQPASLKTREDWQAIWETRKVKSAQKIAFEWSLLPTRQRYQPADYNWGMSVFPLKHGSLFDLRLTWKVNGKAQRATIKDMQCAKDVYIAPATGQ